MTHCLTSLQQIVSVNRKQIFERCRALTAIILRVVKMYGWLGQFVSYFCCFCQPLTSSVLPKS